MTGSLMALDELRLTIASLPDLRTFAFNRLSDKLSLVPLNNSFASFPVTVTVAENGSPKPEFTLNPPKAATEPVEANSDTDNAISLILLSTFKIYPLIIRRHDFNAHNSASYHIFYLPFLPNLIIRKYLLLIRLVAILPLRLPTSLTHSPHQQLPSLPYLIQATMKKMQKSAAICMMAVFI